MEKTSKNILVSIFILLLFSLASAYIIEYFLGYEPCKLCLYQRYPYFISITLIFNILIIRKYIKNSLLILSIVSLFGSILAFYHFGIEQGFFSESFICEATNLDKNLTKEELLSQLSTTIVSCKDVTFSFYGFSLASINTIFSFILFCIFIILFKNYETNR